jgi:hypothetical protein
VQPGGILQSDAYADKRARYTVLPRPVELGIVREDGVRARKGKIGAETGTLVARERIIKRLRRALTREREREEPSEAAAGQTARGIMLRGLPFGVEDLADGRGRVLLLGGRVQKVAYVLGIRVDPRCALCETARVAFHKDGILVVVDIFVSCEQSLSQRGMMLARGVQYETAEPRRVASTEGNGLTPCWLTCRP